MADPNTPNPDGAFAKVMTRNIRALIARRTAEQEKRGLQERIADSITRFTGSMPFVYLHLAVFGCWILMNLPWTPFPKFDPNFIVLAMSASVEAIFLSTFVLITQNRSAAEAQRRAELDLQISLLAEHEVTKLIELVTAIAEHLNLEQARNPELTELKQDVAPEKVLERIENSGV
jgi:uncharacterized membrane protein